MSKLKFVVIFFINGLLFSQISNVKLDHDIYKYLSTLSQKGVLTEYSDLVKPLSRRYIAEKLIEAETKQNKLTKLQKEELKFYSEEFGYEIAKNKEKFNSLELEERLRKTGNLGKVNNNESSKSENKQRNLLDQSWQIETFHSAQNKIKLNNEFKSFENDIFDRWRLFSFKNDQTYLTINPIIGYEQASWDTESFNNISLGLDFNGEVGDLIGFNFELKNVRQSPYVNHYLYNEFTKNTTIKIQLSDAERREYSTVNVDLGVSWDWGSLTIGKNHLNWGYAENGKIVLSEKAPSFPYIRLAIKPAKWFSFDYVHAWLNSEVVDSNAFYSSWRVREYENTDRKVYIQKFIALHSLTITPFKGFDISVGESIVYADYLQPIFFIPIMFFDLADEYLNNANNYAGGSTQLFIAMHSRNHIKNTHLYGSFHADELTPEGLFDPATQYYKFAFTLGGSVVDLPIENLGLTLEYTKVYPGNYRHFIPTLTYESSSALMGHWMGDNGDLVYGAIDYTFFRGLSVKLWTQHIRKGTEAIGNRAYKIQIPQPPFLFTDNLKDRKNYSYYGLDVKYLITHSLALKLHYQYINFNQQDLDKEFQLSVYRDWSISIGYGL